MARVKLDFDFAPMLERIQSANGNVESAAKKAAEASTDIMETSIKTVCDSSGIAGSITAALNAETETKSGGNVFESSVGWKLGSYNPRNPSAGYLAIFFNYGTGKREVKEDKLRVNFGEFKTLGKSRGAITARRFLDEAKKDAKPKIKEIQEGILNDILGGLRR